MVKKKDDLPFDKLGLISGDNKITFRELTILMLRESPIEIIQSALSEDINERIDYDSLELLNSTVVHDPELNSIEDAPCDLLYKTRSLCDDRQEHFIAIVVGHEEGEDFSIPMRMRECGLAVLRKYLEKYGSFRDNYREHPLPLVHQVFLHIGREPYKGPRSLLDQVDPEMRDITLNMLLSEEGIVGPDKMH